MRPSTEKRIKEVMTQAPHTIGSEQTLDKAKHLMAEFGVRHLPVLEGGKCIGILSDRDLKLAYAVEAHKASLLPVAEVCTTEVYTVDPDMPVRDVALYMAQNGIGSALITVVDRVVGIFTSTDACRVLAEVLGSQQD